MINATFCYQYDLEKEKDDSVLYELGIFAIQFATLAMKNERPDKIKALATLSKEGKIVILIKKNYLMGFNEESLVFFCWHRLWQFI